MNLTEQMRVILPGQTIGIIGGGQLGRMMALAAKQSGFKIAVLDPTPNSPCGQVADVEITAAFHDADALEQLAEMSDVVTFEFENIDADSLDGIAEKVWIPQGTDILRITQDRILEKRAIEKSGVRVAPFAEVYDREDLNQALQVIGFPSVLKTARGGYDGKGQLVLWSEVDLQLAGDILAHGPCVLEQFIPFEKEISVIVTRKADGEFRVFPVVENIHVNNILHETIAPARISEAAQGAAIDMAYQLAVSLDLVGTLAIEMFLVSEDEILINELAPRPHNSGHYSIEACVTSQFEQHIRAVCNWPLGQTEMHMNAVMVNVLGEHVDGVIGAIVENPEWKVHFYGKEEAKTGRKMGHITILNPDPSEVLEELELTKIWTNKSMIK
ncbi:5-(carboxyamino)imidazole ribonucleotide synthase [Pradoshia sp.]|uniref:5-(carboxyamino)imidazole ribonucleotide synthase n=1 Tax=Pradoshia sp. TaxID=2651281 RepID=UPI003EFF32D5